jgi:hypothetical protein
MLERSSEPVAAAQKLGGGGLQIVTPICHVPGPGSHTAVGPGHPVPFGYSQVREPVHVEPARGSSVGHTGGGGLQVTIVTDQVLVFGSQLAVGGVQPVPSRPYVHVS